MGGLIAFLKNVFLAVVCFLVSAVFGLAFIFYSSAHPGDQIVISIFFIIAAFFFVCSLYFLKEIIR